MYPDGTRFNMFDFISTEVLQTIEKLNIKVFMRCNTRELRSSIAIGVNLTRPVQERILEARKQGHQYAYFSNEYTIEYTQRNYSILGGETKQ